MFSYWKYQQLANQIYYILSIINQMGCRHLRNFVCVCGGGASFNKGEGMSFGGGYYGQGAGALYGMKRVLE